MLVLAIVLAGCAWVLARAALMGSRQIDVQPAEAVPIDAAQLANELAGALRYRTVSYDDPDRTELSAFIGLHKYLEVTYPRAHEALQREIINEHHLLFKWPGNDPSLAPVLLLGHLDVVPVAPRSRANWTHPPFGGQIADGFIWGRGALDNKSTVMGLLAATEHLLTSGFQPRRTLYFAFGADEEVGGDRGAAHIADRLRRRGVKLEFVLDEGGAITGGIVPGVQGPVALVGIAEKGYLTVELSVHQPGGHSSLPPAATAIGILSRAIARLEARPMPARLTPPVRSMLDYLGPELAFAHRVLVANTRLFERWIIRYLAGTPAGNASVRTTLAATVIDGGIKENVLPNDARALINCRILPETTPEDVLAHIQRAVEDPRVSIRPRGMRQPPSEVSDAGSPAFSRIHRAIRQVFPDVPVAPYLVAGTTDSRHYAAQAKNVYRFWPLTLAAEDLDRLHGIDERIAVDDFARAVRFYVTLMRQL